MAKKSKSYLIEQHKALAKLRKLTNDIVPQIYACFCKVLIENGNTPEDVAELFNRTQIVWNEITESNEIEDMIKWCEATTGITLATGDSTNEIHEE